MAGVPARVYRIPAVRNSDLREFIAHSQQKPARDPATGMGGRQGRSARAWSPAHVSAFLKRIHPPEPWKAGASTETPDATALRETALRRGERVPTY
jgi:hypothetical protein